MRPSDFDYELPPELIAQTPAERRDASRLLVVRPDGLEHRRFDELAGLLPEGALLVVNDTRVLPARLFARKPTGGRIEVLLVEPAAATDGDAPVWHAMIRGVKGLRPGVRLALERRDGTTPPGAAAAHLTFLGDDRVSVDADLDAWGEVPLPPYIERPAGTTAEDALRYQTVFARAPGAVAAPTAGLHFTDELRARFRFATVTLHVGPGTFAPVRVDDLDAHVMHAERWVVPEETARAVAEARTVVAVGTTVARTLESAFDAGAGAVRAGSGVTRLFIRPGYQVRSFDLLLTNFHMPKSTLMMLVAAFAGHERILSAYREAVAQRYRFFSYGDATLLHPARPRR